MKTRITSSGLLWSAFLLLATLALAQALQCYQCNLDLMGQPPRNNCSDVSRMKAENCTVNDTGCFTAKVLDPVFSTFSHFIRGCYKPMIMNSTTNSTMKMNNTMQLKNGSMFEFAGTTQPMNKVLCDLKNHTCKFVCNKSACNNMPTPPLECLECDGTRDQKSCSDPMNRTLVMTCPPQAVACASTVFTTDQGYKYHIRQCVTPMQINESKPFFNHKGCMVGQNKIRRCFGFCGMNGCNSDNATNSVPVSTLGANCTSNDQCKGHDEMCANRSTTSGGKCMCEPGYMPNVMFNCIDAMKMMNETMRHMYNNSSEKNEPTKSSIEGSKEETTQAPKREATTGDRQKAETTAAPAGPAPAPAPTTVTKPCDKTPNPCGASIHKCTNDGETSHVCTCYDLKRWRLSSDRKACININECQDSQMNNCDDPSRAECIDRSPVTNDGAGFTCKCGTGFYGAGTRGTCSLNTRLLSVEGMTQLKTSVSEVMRLPFSFPFSCGLVKEFWIADNGQIWMGSAKVDHTRPTETYNSVGSFPSGKFIENLWKSDTEVLLAPYMTILECDKETPGKGVNYKLLSNENKIDAMILKRMEQTMAPTGVKMPFHAGLVVNWIGCKAMGNHNMTTKFQAIVVTDYNNTRVQFRYDDRDMKMAYSMASTEIYYPVRIGTFCKPSRAGMPTNVQEYPYSGAAKGNPGAINGIQTPDARTKEGALPSSINKNQLGVFTYNTSNNDPGVFKNPSVECGRWLMHAHNVTEKMANVSKICPSARSLIQSGIWDAVSGERSTEFDCFQRVVPRPFVINAKNVWAVLRCCYSTAEGEKSGVVTAPAMAAKGTLPINTVMLVSQEMSPTAESIAQAVQQTSMAFRYCCVDEPVMCKKFMSKVPMTNADKAPQSKGSLCAGDPHFTTLDGLAYTFNPSGDLDGLIATKVNAENSSKNDVFILQVGTRQRNASEKATVFYKVVAQQQVMDNNLALSSSIIEFMMENDTIAVYIDKTKVPDLSKATPKHSAVTTAGGKHSMAFPRYGFAVEATVSQSMMYFSFIITNNIPAMTYKGLLGNNDGNQTNDLLSRNATTPKSTSQSDIYDAMLSWCVDKGPISSLFAVPANPSCLGKDEFVPIYPEALNWTGREREQKDAEKVCRQNYACLYDAYITGQVQSAMATLNQTAIFTSKQTVRVNFAPKWGVRELLLNATKGETVRYTLQADDPDNNTLTYSLGKKPTEGTMHIENGNILTWSNFSDLEGKNITAFEVTASDGLVNVPLTVQIRFCKCHTTQGTCDWGSGNGDFAVVACKCKPGFAPPFCEYKDDPCVQKPCFPGVKCNATDPAILEKNYSAPRFTCGPCPTGYTGDGVYCTDINECAGKHSCDPSNGVCNNTAGSYICGCKKGYVLDSAGKCVDVDECKTSKPCDLKTSLCNNTVGSFNCTCLEGYSMVKGQCQDIDECGTNQHNCDNETTMCTNLQGTFTCNCKSGLRKENQRDTKCIQIDDCLKANCSQNCTDMTNGYNCSCNRGFVVVPDQLWNCKAAEGATCSSAEIQSSCQNGTCAKVDGNVICSCKNTETLVNNICVDKNECAEGKHSCSATTSTCVDKTPGYECKCKTGYNKGQDGFTCIDIDECQAGTHTCDKTNGVCKNTEGNFSCSCKQGYNMGASNACTDVDECSQPNKGGCDLSYGVCANTAGSHTCSCRAGFSGNGFTCSDVDECATDNGGCQQTCSNTVGGRTCSCLRGYSLASDGKTCEDVNECTQNLHKCKDSTYCNNTVGSFKCTCPSGERLHSDGSTCVSILQCDSGHGCQFACNKASNGSQTCLCQPGFKLAADNKACEDINECPDKGATLCPATNKVKCVNTVGSYTCECTNSTYYKKDSDNKCIDKDECLSKPCKAPATCVNKEMGYDCTCPAGYDPKPDALGICKDVNECSSATLNQCKASTGATCVNTIPGFTCKCATGYKLNADQLSCSDVDECSNTPCDPSRGTCTNTAGSYVCGCRPGYSAVNATNCQNMNECKGNHGCQQVCTDTEGSFRCSCQAGYTLNSDGKTCQVATACAANHGCSQLCAVVGGANTCSCYNSSYALGSGGKTCNDVDECKTSPCKGNATCNNLTPGFKCSCTNGYKLNPDEVSCVDRDGNWGAYTAWTTCDKTCGGGKKKQTRTCNNPTKVGNGNDCVGSAVEYATCNTHACPLTTLEISFGAEARYKTNMTMKQYQQISEEMKKLVADKVNEYCRKNASVCCQNVKSPLNAAATFTTASHVHYGGSTPYRTSEILVIVFIIVADKVNGICNDTATTRARRSITSLNSTQMPLSQEVLITVINSQPVKDKLVIIITSHFGTAVTIDTNSTVVIVPVQPTQPTNNNNNNNSNNNNNTTDEKKTKGWIIPVAIIGAVLGILIIVLIVLVVTKKENKVEDTA